MEQINEIMTTLQNSGFFGIIAAIVLFGLFWIIGGILGRFVSKALGRTNLDNKFAQAMGGSKWSIEKLAGKVVKWLVVLFGVTIALDKLNLGSALGPLSGFLETITEAIPSIISALIFLIIGFVIATIVKTLVIKAADSAGLDDRLAQFSDDDSSDAVKSAGIGNALGTGLFWLIILFFLLPALEKLGMDSLVAPLQDMVTQLTNFLPNILSAAIIGLVGWFVARILRQVITGLLGATPLDGWASKAGLNMTLSSLIGTFVYTFVLLLVIVQALDALKIESISAPATSMVQSIFDFVPNLFGAALILGISFFVGRLIAGLVEGLLEGANFNSMPGKMGLNLSGTRTPSQLVGLVILAGIMLLALMTAVEKLGFSQLTGIVETFVGFAGNIILGVIVLGIGFWLANFAHGLAKNAGVSDFVANLVRATVMVLVGAMALQQIGIGEDIVQLAFGIGLGAIGIAAALAFGLGGREEAGRQIEKMVSDDK